MTGKSIAVILLAGVTLLAQGTTSPRSKGSHGSEGTGPTTGQGQSKQGSVPETGKNEGGSVTRKTTPAKNSKSSGSAAGETAPKK